MSNHDHWPLLYVSKPFAVPGSHGYKRPVVVITAGLHHLSGNAKPYWSVTAEMWASAGSKAQGHDCRACGCMHDDIAKWARWLRPVIALHLSDDDGVPMHALENALYWAGATKYQAAKPETLASHLRISLQDAEALIAKVAAGDGRAIMTAEVEAMRPRWKAESDAAKALLLLSRGAVENRP